MTTNPPPRPAPPRAATRAAAAMRKMPRVGWLEVVVLAQTIMPALLFVPALTKVRFVTRALTFLLPLSAWAYYYASGRKVAGGRTYPAAPILAFAAGWLVVSIANPWVNTLSSALCSVAISLGVMSSAFWAPASIRDPRQLTRLMTLMLICNGASVLVGVGQVYQPERFRPPEISVFKLAPGMEEALQVYTDDGRSFLRPPGLTDSPGGAAMGGVVCCAIGLATALSPFPLWWRAAALVLAGLGLGIQFFCQVRILTATLIAGIAAWAVLLALRGEMRKLSLLATLCLGLGVMAVAWVMRDGGQQVMKRFTDVLEDRATTTFYRHRGAFIERVLVNDLPQYPLGAGPGRVGMPSSLFGNPIAPPDRKILYAETQVEAWIYDGGLPLLLAYFAALAVALGVAARTALRCPDPQIAYWAGVVVVYGVGAVVAAFGGQAFMSAIGIQFWALLGALYGAEQTARVASARAAIARAAAAPRVAGLRP